MTHNSSSRCNNDRVSISPLSAHTMHVPQHSPEQITSPSTIVASAASHVANSLLLRAGSGSGSHVTHAAGRVGVANAQDSSPDRPCDDDGEHSDIHRCTTHAHNTNTDKQDANRAHPCVHPIDADDERGADSSSSSSNNAAEHECSGEDDPDSRNDAHGTHAVDANQIQAGSDRRWLQQAARQRLLLRSTRDNVVPHAQEYLPRQHHDSGSLSEALRHQSSTTQHNGLARGKLALGQAAMSSSYTKSNNPSDSNSSSSSLPSSSLSGVIPTEYDTLGWWGCFTALDTWATFTTQRAFRQALQPLDRAPADGFYAAMVTCFALWRAQHRSVFTTRCLPSHTRTQRHRSTNSKRVGNGNITDAGKEDNMCTGAVTRELTIATTQQWYEATRVQRLMVQCLLISALSATPTPTASKITLPASTLSMRLHDGQSIRLTVDESMRQWRFERACHAAVMQAVRKVCGHEEDDSAWVCYRDASRSAGASGAEATSSPLHCATELLTLIPHRCVQSAETDAIRDGGDRSSSDDETNRSSHLRDGRGNNMKRMDSRSCDGTNALNTCAQESCDVVASSSTSWLRDAMCISCHRPRHQHGSHGCQTDCQCQLFSISRELSALPANTAVAVSRSPAHRLHVPTPLRLLLLLHIVDELWSLPAGKLFQLPVSEPWEAPGYYRLIRNPVCLDSLYDAIYHGDSSHTWTSAVPTRSTTIHTAAASTASTASATSTTANTNATSSKNSAEVEFVNYATLRESIVLLKLNCERYNGLGTILAGDAATLLRAALKVMRCTQDTEKTLCRSARHTRLAPGGLFTSRNAHVVTEYTNVHETHTCLQNSIDSEDNNKGSHTSISNDRSDSNAASEDGEHADWTRGWTRSLSELQALFPVRERGATHHATPTVAKAKKTNLAETGATQTQAPVKKSLSLSCAATSPAAAVAPTTGNAATAKSVKLSARQNNSVATRDTPTASRHSRRSYAVPEVVCAAGTTTTTADFASTNAARSTYTLLDDDAETPTLGVSFDSTDSIKRGTKTTTTTAMNKSSAVNAEELQPLHTRNTVETSSVTETQEPKRRLRLGSSVEQVCAAQPGRHKQAKQAGSGAHIRSHSPTPVSRGCTRRSTTTGGEEKVLWLCCDRCDSWRVVDSLPDPLPEYWECAYAGKPCDAAKLMQKMQRKGSHDRDNGKNNGSNSYPADDDGTLQTRKKGRKPREGGTAAAPNKRDTAAMDENGIMRSHRDSSSSSSTSSSSGSSSSGSDATSVNDDSVSDDSSSSSSVDRGRKRGLKTRYRRGTRKPHRQTDDATCSTMLEQLRMIEDELEDVEAMPHNEQPLRLLERLQKLTHRVYNV